MKLNSNRVRSYRNTPEVPSQAFRDGTGDVLTKEEHLVAAKCHFGYVRVISLMISDPQRAYEENDRLEFPIPTKRLISILELNTGKKRELAQMQLDHAREHIEAIMDISDHEIMLSN